MEFEQALEVADEALFQALGRRLTPVEIVILRGAWQRQTYEQIAAEAGYSDNYLKLDVGPKLWKHLSEAFGEKVSKPTFQAVAERQWRKRGQQNVAEQRRQAAELPAAPAALTAIDWGEAPDVSVFYGRAQELETLQQWVMGDRCRLILLLGMGGIGKSSLVVKAVQQLMHTSNSQPFEFVVWRSLRNAPPLEILLADVIPLLSNQQDTQAKPERLLHWLRLHRCLLVLDNLETILQPGSRAGYYQPDYENYGELLKLVGESTHQSCVILTSREKPAEVAVLEGMDDWVRSLALAGSWEASLAILERKELLGTPAEKRQLCEFYNCSPLALKVVASSIQSLFDGEIASFLSEETLVFNGIRRLLEQQFERLSYLEQTIMYWLAINREWTAIAELQENIVPPVSRAALLESLESLTWRNLIEKKSGEYTQQPVVMEYVTDCLTQQLTLEILTNKISFLDRYPLLQTTKLDYIRESQQRLILHPLAKRLREAFRTLDALTQHLQSTVRTLRDHPASFFPYCVGNVLNLSLYLQLDLTGFDFSNLRIQQAYLQGVNLRSLNFSGSTFKHAVFTQPCNEIYAVAFNSDGTQFATGEADGNIRLWRTADGQLLYTLQGHRDSIRAIRFHPSGPLLASGSADRTVRLWDTSTGKCLQVLQGHTKAVLAVVWHPDGQTIASGSSDCTIRLWKLQTGDCWRCLQGHSNWVYSLDWSADGQILASGSADHMIRLWNVETEATIGSLQGHSSCVNSVCFHPDGTLLASGSADRTIRLWNVETGKPLSILQGSSERVNSVHFSPDGRQLASGGADQVVRIWDAQTYQILKSFHEHTSVVFSVRFSPDSRLLLSGGEDHTIRLWDVSTGHTLRTLSGTTGWLYSAQFSPDGRRLASGGDDRLIRLWDPQTKQVLAALAGHTLWIRSLDFNASGDLLASASADRTIRLWDVHRQKLLNIFRGHSDEVRTVCFSPDGTLLASGSQDQTIRIWKISTGEAISILHGHTGWVRSVQFSPDGQQLASGGDDHTVRLWEVASGRLLSLFDGHSNWVRSVKFCPTGRILASSSDDQTILLWDLQTGSPLLTLQGQTNWTRSISFSADGLRLASGGMDRTVRLWDIPTGQELHKFEGHRLGVLSVAFSPDDNFIISSSADETMRLWDLKTGECLHVFRSDRPYEGMNITQVTGLSEAQKATLKALGAIELSPTGQPASADSRSTQRLIGRDREWAMIDRWLQASPDYPAEVLLLLGEAGIGKTRLLAEIARTVESSRGYVLWGRGFAAEMVRPYGAWTDGIRAIARNHNLALPAALELLLQTQPPSDAPVAPHLRDRSSLFDAVVQWLSQLAAQTGPVVILLDDIQWLDEASAALLHYAVRLLRRSPVLFACAARSNELQVNESIAKVLQTLRRERLLQSFTVAPLDQPQTAALMRSIDPDFDPDWAPRVFAESGGNPLFILEIARSQLQPDASIENLESLIQERLLQLDAATRDLLPWAAALGRSFNPNLLARLTDCSPIQLLTAMEQLEQQGIIRPGTVNGGVGYDFAHDIVRQVVYQQLSTPRRRLLHYQIAQTLQQDAIDDTVASDIAHHAALGGDYGLATTASLAAAQRSLRLFAYAEAAELAQRGMQFCQQLDERSRIRFHIHLLKVTVLAGISRERVTSIEANLHRLIAETNRLGLQEEEAIALEALIALHHDHGNLTGVHQHSLQAAERGRTASPTTTARMLAYTGWCLAEIERDMPRAEALLLEAQSLAARVGQDLMDVQSGLGIVRYSAADWPGARLHLQQAWQMAQAAQDHWRTCLCLKYLAMLELEAGNSSDSLRYSREMAIVAAQMDQLGSEGAIAAALTLLAQYASGTVPAAALEQTLSALDQLDDQRMLAYTLNHAAAVDLQQNRVELAIARAAAARAAAAVVEHYSSLAIAGAILGQGYLVLGQTEPAIALLHNLRQQLAQHSISLRASTAIQQFTQQLEPDLIDSAFRL